MKEIRTLPRFCKEIELQAKFFEMWSKWDFMLFMHGMGFNIRNLKTIS